MWWCLPGGTELHVVLAVHSLESSFESSFGAQTEPVESSEAAGSFRGGAVEGFGGQADAVASGEADGSSASQVQAVWVPCAQAPGGEAARGRAPTRAPGAGTACRGAACAASGSASLARGAAAR